LLSYSLFILILRTIFPNAEFVWFADTGHWMHVERHEEFMRTIVPYLEAP
jgi:pimeloyl-ACP methyl ester carboxylesterase